MAMETVHRRWTIVTWLLARGGDRLDAIVAALSEVDFDVVALQSTTESDAEQIIGRLGCAGSWARSHHPRSRLLPGSAIGLALVTPHRIVATDDHVIGDHRSMWSTRRRIVQRATIERDDHSGYTVSHAVEHVDDVRMPPGGAPPVLIRPAQVGIDDSRAIQLPAGAEPVSTTTTSPVDGVAPLLAVTFEMPWVSGDFFVG